MGNFFCRLFAPWKAEGCFDELDDFYDFLLRRNRALNAVRVLFFAAAAVCLMLGYAFEPQPYKHGQGRRYPKAYRRNTLQQL